MKVIFKKEFVLIYHTGVFEFFTIIFKQKNILIGPYLKPNQREKPTLCYEVCTKGWAGLGILGPYIKKQANQSLSRMEVLILK